MDLSSNLAAGVIVELLKVLVPFIHQNVKSFAWGFKDDLEKLGNTLVKIEAVMKDADRLQVTDESVLEWLKDLRDIAYDVEDVLDDFSYLVMRKETIRGWKNKVGDSVSSNNPLYSRFKIAREIKDINKRLEKIQEHKVMFQSPIVNAPTTIIVHQGQSSRDSRETASHPPKDTLIGRDNDKLEIIKLLTSSQSEELAVLPIVGMGGGGKTTLAQSVCNDKLIVNYFRRIIWVYVSEKFDVNKILQEILHQVRSNKTSAPDSLELLIRELKEILMGEKVLLVLDDLWNQDTNRWEQLKDALTSAGMEGKILVTTRKEQVASTVRGAIDPYDLKQLTEDECWSIIMKRAFAPGGATETKQMVKIGEEIAGKCCGLPLVARTLGSLMHKKKTLSEWGKIAAKDVFNLDENDSKIISILKLSYDNLSSQLKRCFSYCCIFPKDLEIERKNLINIWMAEGFIQQSGDGNRNARDCDGNDCFEQLLQSSLFQEVTMDKFGEVYKVKMHDLIHDLARHVLDDYECSVLKTSGDRLYDSEGRRVQVAFDADGEISPLFRKSLAAAEKLRTIIATQGNYWRIPVEMFLANERVRVLYVMFRVNIGKCLASISKLRHLRYLNLTMGSPYHKFSPDEYLDLSLNRAITGLFHMETLVLRYSGIKNLPEDVGSLKQLRHLDLGFNRALEELPDSITCLSNLQTLNLNECGLKFLPEQIGALKHLRYLNLGRTRIEGLPESITDCCNLEMLDLHRCKIEALPRNIGDLKSLKCLDISSNRIIEELPITFGALNELTFFDFRETRIKELPESCDEGLNSLKEIRESDDYETFKEVKNWMNSVKHNNGSGTVDLRDYRNLPSRIRDLVSRLNSTTYTFSVRRSKGIGDLGEVNLLGGNLQILDLQNVRGGAAEARRANLKLKENITRLSLQWDVFRKVVTGGASRVLEELQPHPNLRELSIHGFEGMKLPSWLTDNGVSPSLPNLVEINLRGCSGCKQILGLGLLPSLKKLILHNLYSLEWAETTPTVSPGTCYYPALEELQIISCPYLKSVPTSTFPSLKKLCAEYFNKDGLCSLLRNNLTSLTEAKVNLDLSELKFLPVEIWQPGLESLQVLGDRKFQGFGWTKEECRSFLSRMTSLRILVITYSEEWNPLKDLQYLPNLEELQLFSFSDAEGSAFASASLPAEADELETESIQNLISIHSLTIGSWSKGNSFLHQFEHLSGLRRLTIQGFHDLVVLPEWLRNFSSLEELNVYNCPQLEYTYADREEYQKISHIKDILFRRGL